MPRFTRRTGLITVVVAASMVVGACSSSDDTATTTTTAKAASTTIRIGLEGPLSGEQKNTGTGMLQGADPHGAIFGERVAAALALKTEGFERAP